ncbi:hypothetical protein [Psychrosphaera algicola]|uniref:DNA ligase n=1 Tax=Psychrosphaera algicola TaxID=3023714 RepID=A0ABT5FE83_9GAMM|nr:hypothetical protein [Psychrosphaera sp. G1-22]MDC2889384.1 hypothetical protein [Psychrosphaera sp. G1-22]
MQNFILVCCFAVLVLFPVYIWAKPKPVDLMLAKVADIKNLFAQHQGYWLSEKYDGIRAYWNGTTLLTRRGNQIHCPQWFIENLPKTALDGELWISRGQFEQVSSTVRKNTLTNPNGNMCGLWYLMYLNHIYLLNFDKTS